MKKIRHIEDRSVNLAAVSLRPDQININSMKLDRSKKLITINSLADMKYEYANPALLKVLGYSEPEFLSKKLDELIHPDDVARVMSRIRREAARGNEVGEDEFRVRRRDGSYLWVESTGIVVPGDNGDDSLLSFSRDISERKNAEAQLRLAHATLERSDKYYQTLFENSGTAIMILDRNFGLLHANPRLEELTGYACQELLDSNPLELLSILPPASLKPAEGLLERPDHDAAANEYEVLLRPKVGSPRNVLVIVDRIPGSEEYVAVLKDVTRKKRAEATMARQMAAQRLLLDVARNFANVGSYNIDAMINLTLKMIGEFDHSDRTYIVRFSEDGQTMSATHEWCAEGVSPGMQLVQAAPVDQSSWWMQNMHQKPFMHINRADDVPGAAQQEKDLLMDRSIKSVLVVPMYLEEKLIAYLGLDALQQEKNWTDDSITLLQSVAQTIAIAFRRQRTARALEASENYYRTVFQNTGAATLIMEADMTITDVNEELLDLFNCSAASVVGADWRTFVPPEIRGRLEEYHRLRRLDPNLVPRKYPIEIVDRQSRVREGILTVDLIPGTTATIVTFADLTEHKRISRALEAMNTVNQAITRADRKEELLEQVCRYIVEIGKYSLVWGGLAPEDSGHKVKPLAWAGRDNGYVNKMNICLDDPKRGAGPTGRALRTGLPVVSRNFKNDPSFKPWLKDALRRGFRSMMAIPLKYDNRVWGILGIYSDALDCFDRAEQKLLTDMGDNMAYALAAIQTREERNQATHDLGLSIVSTERLLMQAVDALGLTLEARDPVAAGHQKQVGRLAGLIAGEMGLSEEEVQGIIVAGSLHDLGKIVVPAEILGKTEELTGPEYSIVKTHCQAGCEVIKVIDFPWPIADIVLQHHERLDGSGYPRGLSGDEILMAARIMAVADVVAAMSSPRPYRPAHGLDIALAEIWTYRGVRYDPAVVDACLSLFREKGIQI